MKVEYDKYYQTENLFGEPYPELIKFYSSIKTKGNLLDLGCGQGRDALVLAKLGYVVTGVDNSKVGIVQLNNIAEKSNLLMKGIVGDIYLFSGFEKFDFILLDSMFHFGKREVDKESEFLKRIFNDAKKNCLITICIQNTGNKVQILEKIIGSFSRLQIKHQEDFMYNFEDISTNHSSTSKYKMLTVEKI